MKERNAAFLKFSIFFARVPYKIHLFSAILGRKRNKKTKKESSIVLFIIFCVDIVRVIYLSFRRYLYNPFSLQSPRLHRHYFLTSCPVLPKAHRYLRMTTIENLKSFDPFAEADEDELATKKQNYIHIRIQQRNGRKTLTTVQGLPSELSFKRLLKTFKKVVN